LILPFVFFLLLLFTLTPIHLSITFVSHSVHIVSMLDTVNRVFCTTWALSMCCYFCMSRRHQQYLASNSCQNFKYGIQNISHCDRR